MKLLKIYIPLVATIVCIVARWILVVGYGDFGTDYDYVSRLFQSQWQGRDFFSVYPPLSGYSLLLFAELFGQNYLTINIHLWFWWAANFITASAIMHAYKGTKEMIVLVALTVALLTIPINMHGSSFAYIASTLSGLSIFYLLKYWRTKNIAVAIIAGLFGGIAIVAKPNVGVAILGAIAVACFGAGAFKIKFRKEYINCFTLVLIGALCGVFAAIAIPGWYGGYLELAKEVFLGGSEIKGGVWLLLRAIPRISLTLEAPLRWVVEFCLTVPLLVFFIVIFSKITGNAYNVDNFGAETDLNFAEKYLWLFFIFIIVLSGWSLWQKEFPWKLTAIFNEWGFTSLPFLLWQILYLAVFAGQIVVLGKGVARKEYLTDIGSQFWSAVICLTWTLGVVASGRYNIVFAATLFVPMIVYQYAKQQVRIFYKVMIVLLMGWTFAWHIAPNWKSTFSKLTPLPNNSKFSGLYWPDGGAQVPGSYPFWNSSETINELINNISPIVKNKSVLWLVPGPGAAFGGDIYSYGVVGLSSNNVPVWGEKILSDSIRNRPPDYIVSSNIDEWSGSKWSFMTPDIALPWIRENYNLVWMIHNKSAPIYMWEKKTLSSDLH